MKFFSANLKDLRELYYNSLQKALDMEQQIIGALPTMIEKASDLALKEAFRNHLKETVTHATRLERFLDQAQGEANPIKCKALSALISEAQDCVTDAADPSVCDAALLSTGQQVEHHEIAVYGTLRTWAGILGETEQAATLERTLQEEKQADVLLTDIASRVNIEADTPALTTA